MEWIDRYWFELWGIFLMFLGTYVFIKRKVGVGYEFEKPKSYVRGKAAVLIGVIILIIGIWILANSTELRTNQCLEKGLEYSHESGQCSQ